MLQLDHVSQVFQDGKNRHLVLDDVDLTITPGEYLSVRGPSGCGKSTMLAIASLLLQPTGGEVRIDGQPVSGLPGERRVLLRGQHMGLVFQNANLIGCLNPVENIGLALHGRVRAAERRRRALDLLERVGLAGRADADVQSLSGGEAQRVALCRAVVNRPRFLFCDEPTGALDGANSGNVVRLLEELWRADGCALVVVTHDADLWRRASRRLAMADGRLVDETSLPDAGPDRTPEHRHALV